GSSACRPVRSRWCGHELVCAGLWTRGGAGVYGLNGPHDYGSQPLLAGILLAVAAGMLALALVRVVAFLGGGVCASLLGQALAPSWNDPLVFFLAGGLLGLVLFRVWTLTLTSLGGTLLMTYSGLCLADRLGKLDAVDWSERQTLLLNWGGGALTLLGLLAQVYVERRRARKLKEAEQKKKEQEMERERERAFRPEPPKSRW